MSKSKNGSKGRDGRKGNVPPEHGKIQSGEVRNPWGRAGKPQSFSCNAFEELFLQEACRNVSHDVGGPVDLKRRLVQEELLAALNDSDGATRLRVLNLLREVSAIKARSTEEILEVFVIGKYRLTDEFDLARKMGQSAPDVLPHPDHVEIIGDELYIRGPMDRRSRAVWEDRKTAIRVTACFHQIVRDEYRRTGCPSVLAELKAIEKHRRWLMRTVPKGWNWREEIYCRNSSLEFAKETVRKMKEMGYVSPDA